MGITLTHYRLSVFAIFFILHSLFLQTFAFIAQNGRQSNSWNSLLLRGGAVDPCLWLPTLLERGECLQSVMELYYGTRPDKVMPFVRPQSRLSRLSGLSLGQNQQDRYIASARSAPDVER